MAQKYDPREHGVDLELEEFVDIIAGEFNTMYRSQWTIDDLCCHPTDAMAFCRDIRLKHGWFSMPDHVILKRLMNRRKNP